MIPAVDRRDPRLTVLLGDITTLPVDVIVNAANSGLWGGGGVDGAIHRAAGPELSKACDDLRALQGGCPTGQAVLTSGFSLKAKHIVHTVGPIWGESKSPEVELAACYRSSLALIRSVGAVSAAFPNISTGVYGFPKENAAKIAVQVVRDVLATAPNWEVRIVFCCYNEENLRLYEREFHT